MGVRTHYLFTDLSRPSGELHDIRSLLSFRQLVRFGLLDVLWFHRWEVLNEATVLFVASLQSIPDAVIQDLITIEPVLRWIGEARQFRGGWCSQPQNKTKHRSEAD